MSHVCLLVFLALFLSLTYTTTAENHFPNNQETRTYIVSIQNSLKTSNFVSVEEWYKFILSKANSDFNDDSLIHVYKTVFHGFSARLRPEQVNLLRAQVEVIEVFPDQMYQLHTTRSPYFLGLNTYHKPRGLLKDSDLGSNVVVGVIDSGIWPESPSFSDEDMGPVPSHFKGVCNGGENFPPCNKKIVGVRHFGNSMLKDEPLTARDTAGHGTHTASIIAGRTRPSNSSFFGYAKGEATGVAPKARLAIYKVCWALGCLTSDVLMGIEKAVEDGVNVISISLGGFQSRYNIEPISIGAFGAMQKGIIVSAAAGNAGPVMGRAINIAPWIITVGASTIDRTFPAEVILDNGVALQGSSLYKGKPLPSKKTFPLIHFPSHYDKQYCMQNSLHQNDVKGKIVVCMDGIISPVSKGVEVQRAGGVGVIVAMNYSSETDVTFRSQPFWTPGLTIPSAATVRLFEYLGNQTVKEATLVFLGTQIGKQPAPVVASFSSRGPNVLSQYVLKPDFMAPGVHILAAWPNYIPPSLLSEDPRRSEFNIMSGTSMACPHVSGVAALLKGAHPDWTPAMVRSALMTTTYTGYRKMEENRQNSKKVNKLPSFYETGAGQIDPEKANDPGLVLDITEDEYIKFLCASNYNETELQTIVKRSVSCDKMHVNLWDLNYPAIIVTPDLDGKGITRTLTSMDSTSTSYTAMIKSPTGTIVTVSPDELSFKTKGEKQNFTVRVVALNKGSMESEAMGSVTWTDGKRNITIPLMAA